LKKAEINGLHQPYFNIIVAWSNKKIIIKPDPIMSTGLLLQICDILQIVSLLCRKQYIA